jgi:hypothetical protein
MTTQPLDLTSALAAPRVVIEAELEPLIGSRIQPTGFPNLGAAEFSNRTVLAFSSSSLRSRLQIGWKPSHGTIVPSILLAAARAAVCKDDCRRS